LKIKNAGKSIFLPDFMAGLKSIDKPAGGLQWEGKVPAEYQAKI